ncbi:hypothetical protein BGZ61DRAFT_468502 [Ilyonectria robusta]|uniref:uncharacterized protein n=1 Tax=Ilyonectria robusta TaxID=1079257 RepID=UPI001E8D4479|nr:uncharacterized protein BGZ61DRAFT_468502 [Ilyonectria robusta]KAH8652851.1 hypothetical protein BGZ61DRAFT_468502 [Ilyonectria robusta]
MTVKIWDAVTEPLQYTLESHSRRVTFSADGRCSVRSRGRQYGGQQVRRYELACILR